MKQNFPNPSHVAKSWSSTLGRKKSEKANGNNTSNLNSGVDLLHLYDLYVEKEDLKSVIVKKKSHPVMQKISQKSLTLTLKKKLIRLGKVESLLYNVKKPFQEVAKSSQVRIQEINGELDRAFSIHGVYDKFQEDLSRHVKIRREARIVRNLDKFIEQMDLLILNLTREVQLKGKKLAASERKKVEDSKILKREATQKRQELLDDFDVFNKVRFWEIQEYRQELAKDRSWTTSPQEEASGFGKERETDDLTVNKAKKIMGRDFFGVEAIEKAFNVQLNPHFDIPLIPFSKERLEQAKLHDQFLILRIGEIEKQLLTMSNMEAMLQPLLNRKGEGKVMYSMRWYRNQVFFNDESLKSSWALVSKESIPNSTNKNYLQQTESLVTYLRSIFGKALPAGYAQAISEFKKKKKDIEKLLSSNLRGASEQLSDLKINQMMRHRASEVFYDDIIYFQNTGRRLLEAYYAWTNTRSSCGRLVLVGPSDVSGVRLGYWEPVDFLPRFGLYVSFVD